MLPIFSRSFKRRRCIARRIQPSLLVRYQRLLDISRDLASTLDLDVLLRRIVRAAADLCDSEQASILLYDQVKGELYFEAATNMHEPALRGLSVPVEGSIAGWIVTQRQAIILSDASQDDRHYGRIENITHTRTTTLLGVPLITKDKVVGALEAINKRSGDYTQEDQNILTILGAQAAVAIENTRLFQQSDLISELVHELRTPLASLNTAIHLITRDDVPEEQQKRVAEIIQDEISRLSDLASTFLDLAKLESGRAQFQMTSFNPLKLLEDCEQMMNSRAIEKDITLSSRFPAELPLITADQDKIKQVIINLISNAIKYNRPQGKITLSALANKEKLHISISDTGFGIPPESMPFLFHKFYRVPGSESISSGTGLGLSICKKIVEAHHGSIDVKSVVDQGTTFTVNLPLAFGEK